MGQASNRAFYMARDLWPVYTAHSEAVAAERFAAIIARRRNAWADSCPRPPVHSHQLSETVPSSRLAVIV